MHEIDDLISCNLDIERFAADALRHYEGSDFVAAFYDAIAGTAGTEAGLLSNQGEKRGITVLDPACGSGAFLFAALNILEPLYAICIERMREFVDEDDRLREQGKRKGAKKYPGFRKVLEDVASHPNEKYWIYKTIILNNLYGVDIMKEAAEIAKLRLFLKLAAEAEYDRSKDNLGLEPLPDIDFNIRSGNSLVGFASMAAFEKALTPDKGQHSMEFNVDLLEEIREEANLVQKAHNAFKHAQDMGSEDYRQAKTRLMDRLGNLNDKMNHYLARQYGKDETDYDQWLKSHQPFHWMAEFYGIIEEDGGFDVVIGNPPYVSSKKINYTTIEGLFPDIYANMITRSSNIVKKRGNLGMIIPLSIMFSEDYKMLRKSVCLEQARRIWLSSYDNIPASIFSGVSQRCTIFLKHFSDSIGNQAAVYVSPMYRWRARYRKHLTNSIGYCELGEWDMIDAGIPKIANHFHFQVLEKIHNRINPQAKAFKTATAKLGFSPVARNFVSVFSEPPPCIDSKTMKMIANNRPIFISFFYGDKLRDSILVSLAGDLYFYYWLSRGDGFDVTKWIIGDFSKCIQSLPDKYIDLLSGLGGLIQARKNLSLVFKKNAGKYVGNYNYTTQRFLTRRGDMLVMAGLGLDINHVREVFSYVTRVLSINRSSGEKAIPDSLKKKFAVASCNEVKEKRLLKMVDKTILSDYHVTPDELNYLINDDIKYRMGLTK